LSVPHPSKAHAFEWDEDNEDKLALRKISAADVEHVWLGGPTYLRNKRSGTANWKMIGRDTGGRELCIGILWADSETRILRAVFGWPT